MSPEFLLTSLIIVAMPGTGVIYTLAIGLGRGFKASIAAAFGCTLGILPSALASIVGLAAVLHTSAVAFQTLKFLGVVYLFYMAWRTLRDSSVLDVSETRSTAGWARIALDGALLNVLNPKLSLFFLAFLPQFVAVEDATATASLISLAGVFMAMTFGVFVLYGLCAAYARDYVIRRPSVMAWIKRGFAAAFGALGIKLAVSNA